MMTNMKAMYCGNCGHRRFAIYQEDTRDGVLVVECEQCRSTTVIRITAPQLRLEFGDGSRGILAMDVK